MSPTSGPETALRQAAGGPARRSRLISGEACFARLRGRGRRAFAAEGEELA